MAGSGARFLLVESGVTDCKGSSRPKSKNVVGTARWMETQIQDRKTKVSLRDGCQSRKWSTLPYPVSGIASVSVKRGYIRPIGGSAKT